MLIDGKRALAYTAAIDEIKPREGYDRVEYARVSGWWVIVAKADSFKVGDTCIYFEVDSLCPAAISARKKWFEREKELASWRQEELDKGLSMLRENFSALWD